MRHNYVSDDFDGAHWAVGQSSGQGLILVQVQDADGVQARVAISQEHAQAMAQALLDNVSKMVPQGALAETP